MNNELKEFLKSIYDINKNDGKIRQYVWNNTENQTEYTRTMIFITE